MKHCNKTALLTVVVLACVSFPSTYLRAQDSSSVSATQSYAPTVDESLLILPDGKDASFYRDAYSKLEDAFTERMEGVDSLEALTQTVNACAPAAETIYRNLAKSSEDDIGAAGTRSFNLYALYLTLNGKLDDLRAAFDNARLKFADVKEFENAEQFSAGILNEMYSVIFENACSNKNVGQAQALGVKIAEEAMTNDFMLDDLRGIIRNAGRLSPDLGLELLDKVEDGLSKSKDPKRRSFAELFEQEKEELTKFFEGAKRFHELPGKTIEINGLYLDGSEIDRSCYCGKTTLVCIWATWCDACIREIPSEIKLYRKYRDAGFEILAYSVDSDLNALKEFSNAARLPWKIASSQLAEEANARKGKEYVNFIEYYGIEFLPCMILVDRDGKVIDTNARGKKLEQLLKQAFPNAEEPTVQTQTELRKDCDELYLFWTKKFRDSLEKDEKLTLTEKISILQILALTAYDFERYEEAVEYAERGIALIADSEDCRLNTFAWILVSCPQKELRNGKLALEAAKKIKNNNSSSLLTLAAAYAETGDFENAVNAANASLKLAENTVKNGISTKDALDDCRKAVELFSKKETWSN